MTNNKSCLKTPRKQPRNRHILCGEHWTMQILEVDLNMPHLCLHNSRHHYYHPETTTSSLWPYLITWEVNLNLTRTRKLLQRWHTSWQKNGWCLLSSSTCSRNYPKTLFADYSRKCIYSKSWSRLRKNTWWYYINDESSTKSFKRSFFEVLFSQNV